MVKDDAPDRPATGRPATGRPARESSRPRSDAVANHERVLAAAVTAILREGRQVPMASIADDAGVGVGTLYRNYPTREALLTALTERSFELVKNVADDVAAAGGPAIAAIEAFLDRTIDHRDQLVLPLHGGPSELSEQARRIRDEIHAGIDGILERGRADGTVRADVKASDVVFFGALLAQPLSSDPDHLAGNSRRQARIFLAGLAPAPQPLGDYSQSEGY